MKNILERQELDELAKIAWDKLTFENRRALMQYLIGKVILDGNQIRIEIEREKISYLKKWQDAIEIQQGTKDLDNVYLSSNGKTINILTEFDQLKVKALYQSNSLLWNIAKGYQYREWLESGVSLIEISRKEKKQDGYINRILKLGYLSPKIVEAIVDNNYSENLDLITLRKISEEIDWVKQEREIEPYIM